MYQAGVSGRWFRGYFRRRQGTVGAELLALVLLLQWNLLLLVSLLSTASARIDAKFVVGWILAIRILLLLLLLMKKHLLVLSSSRNIVVLSGAFKRGRISSSPSPSTTTMMEVFDDGSRFLRRLAVVLLLLLSIVVHSPPRRRDRGRLLSSLLRRHCLGRKRSAGDDVFPCGPSVGLGLILLAVFSFFLVFNFILH